MYSSSSSSPQNSSSNLARYGSAPSSVFSNAVDSVMAGRGNQNSGQYFDNSAPPPGESTQSKNTLSLLRSYGGGVENDDGMNSGGPMSSATTSSNLIRHSSSPAGFLNHFTPEIGFSISKGVEGYNSQGGNKLSRLGSSQLSFTSSKQDHQHQHQHQHHHHHQSLSQIAEVNECSFDQGMNNSHHDDDDDDDHDHHHHNRSGRSGPSNQSSRPVSDFSLSTWDESSNNSRNIVFSSSASSSRHGKNIHDDIINGLASLDAQVLELGSMDRLLHVPQDSVPCKIRAKRGCATHPRSIAERERRTRISGKLKKLQELVPNMDKQTSYSDMLDLAVQHIKGLQNQIQKLHKDLENCTCGCRN